MIYGLLPTDDWYVFAMPLHYEDTKKFQSEGSNRFKIIQIIRQASLL